MSDIKKLTKKILDFRNARNWKQFHKPKDLALSLMLEAAEVGEHFQWKNEKEIKAYIKQHKNDIGEELADTFYWVLLMAHDLKIDLVKIFDRKMKKNEKKYPIAKAKGKHTKYTEF
jgi:NTP pyrophosphatase (non-canonical NTP hydrolase)